MIARIALLLTFAVGIAGTSGCATSRATASRTPGADLSNIKSVYVIKDPDDGRDIDQVIAKAFIKRGFDAKHGPAKPLPYSEDASVSYIDKWMWDITMYMLELTITIRNPSNDFPMAVGNSYHTSLVRKTPEEMVDEVLTNIFNSPKK